jgi:hypothetical protein
MPTRQTGSDTPLFEQAAAAEMDDSALRQLRRRYEALRRDYESLLDRVGDLEEHQVLSARAKPQRGGPSEPPTAGAGRVAEGLVSPLLGLRDEYLSAASGIQTIVESLDRLAAQAFRGTGTAAPQATPAVRAVEPVSPGPREESPRRIHLDVSGQGFGELLDFQERVSGIAGVARVSISAIESDRASLVVELEPERP